MINQLINYTRSLIMAKKKKKGHWGGYNQYTLKDGTKFLARDDHDANLYRIRCRNIENGKKVGDFVVVDDAGVNIKTGKFTG